jgi:DNA-binding NarL/FixJ family response regulator
MRESLIVAERLGLVRDGLMALLVSARASNTLSDQQKPVLGAATLDDAVALMAHEPDGVLLLDLGLFDAPVGSSQILDRGLGQGLSAGLQAIRSRFPAWHVVALSERETRDGVLQCLAAGAHGVIAKTAGTAELLRAIAVVANGGVHVPAVMAAPEPIPAVGPIPGLVAGPSVPARAPYPEPVSQLTDRQRDVLRLMAEGRSTKDIARTLDLAVSTIKVHLAAVYRTVGARNRVEALCRAGLLPRDPLVS